MWTMNTSGDRKRIVVLGPGLGYNTFTIEIDRDDMPTEEVDTVAEEMLRVLNRHMPTERIERALAAGRKHET